MAGSPYAPGSPQRGVNLGIINGDFDIRPGAASVRRAAYAHYQCWPEGLRNGCTGYRTRPAGFPSWNGPDREYGRFDLKSPCLTTATPMRCATGVALATLTGLLPATTLAGRTTTLPSRRLLLSSSRKPTGNCLRLQLHFPLHRNLGSGGTGKLYCTKNLGRVFRERLFPMMDDRASSPVLQPRTQCRKASSYP